MTTRRKASVASIEKAGKLLAEQLSLEADRIQDQGGRDYHMVQHEMRQRAGDVLRHSESLIHSRGRDYKGTR